MWGKSYIFYASILTLAMALFINAVPSANAAESANFSDGYVVIGEDDAATCDSSIKGAMRYYDATSRPQYCNGSDWVDMTYDPGVSSDEDPDAFTFVDLTDKSLNQVVYSETLTITGFDGPLLAEVSGSGSPAIRVNGGTWGSAIEINPGDTLQVRQTTSGSASTGVTAAVTVGNYTDNWVATTAASGTRIFFTNGAYQPVTNFNGLLEADEICQGLADTQGFGGNWYALLSTDNINVKDRVSMVFPLVNACDSSNVSTTDVWTDQSIDAVVKSQTCSTASNNVWSGSTAAGLTYASYTCTSWTSNSGNGRYGTLWATTDDWIDYSQTACSGSQRLMCVSAPTDITPTSFTFTDLTDQTYNSTVTSNTITLGGFTDPLYVSISGHSSAEFRVNSGSWVSEALVDSGDTLQLRMDTPLQKNMTYSATITVGSYDTDWDVSTGATGATQIFVTTTQYTGDLGGFSGADTKCQAAASAAGFSGTWKALLSDATTDAKDRITFNFPMINACDASIVSNANIWSLGALDTASPKKSTCATTAGANRTWTGTNDDGTKSADTCSSWTTTSGSGAEGGPSYSSTGTWINDGTSISCTANNKYLYCVQ